MYSNHAAICDGLTLAHGVISYSPFTTPRLEGTVATHSCDEGYGLSPSVRTKTCQSDRTWSGEDIICQCENYHQKCFSSNFMLTIIEHAAITCPPLTHPHGSVLHFFPEPPYPFGTQAQYLRIACPEGTQRRGGNNVRNCTGDGHGTVGVWNGTAPICAGMYCINICHVCCISQL